MLGHHRHASDHVHVRSKVMLCHVKRITIIKSGATWPEYTINKCVNLMGLVILVVKLSFRIKLKIKT